MTNFMETLPQPLAKLLKKLLLLAQYYVIMILQSLGKPSNGS
jgi:hypothetical protein